MGNIIARNPTSGEVEKAAEIALKAFGHGTMEQWHSSYKQIEDAFGLRYILVVEHDGELVSSLVCTPGPVYIAGSSVPHSAVGAVGTLAEHRKHGCAHAMMVKSVQILREEEIYLSSLWPFSYKYYRKFGWEVGSEIRSFGAQGKVFAEMGDPSKVRGVESDDLEAIKEIYTSYVLDFNCSTDRSDHWWNAMNQMLKFLKFEQEAGHGTVVHVTEDEVDGYAVYELTTGENGISVNVKESAFEFPEHRRDMLAFLGSVYRESQMVFGAPMSDLFLQELPDPRVVTTVINPSFQFRVIDPEKAISSMGQTGDESLSGRFTLKLTDPVFTQGFEFGVQVDAGVISICKPSPKNRLSMSVETLARVYSGYLSAADAWGLGRIEVDEAAIPALELATEVFSPLTPYRSWIEPG